MGIQQSDGKMEGWLYLIRLNRFGFQYSRKRYFILEDNCLRSFKSIPTSEREEPVRSAIIDSCIRVTDNGRKSYHRKVFFVFSLCNTSNHKHQLKLGASSPEEAARWIRSLQDTAINPGDGYVITRVNQGKESVVRHMLAIDWKFWKPYLRKASARSLTIRMLERITALREMFRAKAGNNSSEFSSRELTRDIGLPQIEQEDIKTKVALKKIEDKVEAEKPLSGSSSLMGLNDAADEFFDVLEPSDDDQLEHEWPSNLCSELGYLDMYQPKLSSAASFGKKLHDLAVQKKGYIDLQEVAWEENVSCFYGATLPKDSSCTLACSWAEADPSTFLIRGDNYLEDHQKIKAKGTLMQMVAADWIRSDKREDDLGGRSGGIVQKYAAKGGPEFFLIINMQIPGTTTYSIALYYMMKTPWEENPLLVRFVNGDDAYRNSRFKLIPCISKGSWIVKQCVGKKACLIGQKLEVHYFRGKNYLELDVDVGSSTVARGVASLVLGYLNNMVAEMAFLIQANTQEELPEFLLGTCRLNYLDVSKSV